ncbi:hypothetical protein HZ326_24646 [Fusarium oxysporum f. sp. albedinis]|nr:hypothetical protein HZ326_24646 [Fusarium oxysporum f. sp. albedinis]
MKLSLKLDDVSKTTQFGPGDPVRGTLEIYGCGSKVPRRVTATLQGMRNLYEILCDSLTGEQNHSEYLFLPIRIPVSIDGLPLRGYGSLPASTIDEHMRHRSTNPSDLFDLNHRRATRPRKYNTGTSYPAKRNIVWLMKFSTDSMLRHLWMFS